MRRHAAPHQRQGPLRQGPSPHTLSPRCLSPRVLCTVPWLTTRVDVTGGTGAGWRSSGAAQGGEEGATGKTSVGPSYDAIMRVITVEMESFGGQVCACARGRRVCALVWLAGADTACVRGSCSTWSLPSSTGRPRSACGYAGSAAICGGDADGFGAVIQDFRTALEEIAQRDAELVSIPVHRACVPWY